MELVDNYNTPICPDCQGTGLDQSDYIPTEHELKYCDPRRCNECAGTGHPIDSDWS